LTLLSRGLSITWFVRSVLEKMISSYASAHTTSLNRTFFMLFKLLTIIVVITTDWVLLNLLLLLHLVFLFLLHILLSFCESLFLFSTLPLLA